MNGCRNWKRRLAGSAVAASMLIGGPAALAVTQDGTVGPDSTGTVDVRIFVPDLVLIENLDDILLNYIPGGGDVVVTEPFCIWATAGTLYDITISSDTPTSTSTFVANGTSGSVQYTVDFDDAAAGGGWESVVEGALLNNAGAGYVGAAGVPPGCPSDNARLRVSAAEASNLDSAVADTYGDTLTLLVTPL